jgi:hypothetical protein
MGRPLRADPYVPSNRRLIAERTHDVSRLQVLCNRVETVVLMRREFVLGAAACSAGAPLLMACSSGAGHDEATLSLHADAGVGALRNPDTVKPQHAVLAVPLA